MKRLLFILFLSVCTTHLVQAQKVSKWDYLITIQTSLGEMKAILHDATPKHKQNFLKLIDEGFYDSLLFHRVIEDFMIQGGDPDSKGAAPDKRLGRGGPGYRVDAEINPQYFHKKGALSAARQGDQVNPEKKSSGSQFYIVQGDTLKSDDLVPLNRGVMRECLPRIDRQSAVADSLDAAYAKGVEVFEQKLVEMSDGIFEMTGFRLALPQERVNAYTTVGGTPHLDDQYTVFGQVIVGLDVIDKIAAVQTGRGDRPAEDVYMVISAERMKRKKIIKQYGDIYQQ